MTLPIPQGSGIERLKEIVRCLRSPEGCPWDIEQTHESLLSNLLEEAYEVVDAIKSGDSDHMKEELGDLLLQVVMHGEIAAEGGVFDFEEIADEISEKLIRRHPHVFGDFEADDTEAVLKRWEEIKAEERAAKGSPKEEGFLLKVGEGLPAMYRAVKIQKKVSKVGFDWSELQSLLDKISEEVDEVSEAVESGKEADIADEIGDLLFVTVNLARKLKLDPELLLHGANEKFTRRFHHIEEQLNERGSSLEASNLEEMDRFWNQAKERGL